MIRPMTKEERIRAVERALLNNNDVKQELADLKEWIRHDFDMSPEDFDKYWRQERVKLYM
jgi:hypothetical protein